MIWKSMMLGLIKMISLAEIILTSLGSFPTSIHTQLTVTNILKHFRLPIFLFPLPNKTDIPSQPSSQYQLTGAIGSSDLKESHLLL